MALSVHNWFYVPGNRHGAGGKLQNTHNTERATRPEMVRWYNPRLLLQTGVRVAIATVVGQIADYREVQAALDPIGDDPLKGAFDYSGQISDNGFWFDYVSDIGDGWHSSNTIAGQLARPELSAGETETRRGQLLVMGGDEVYPGPSPQAYKDRLIDPYASACENNPPFAADLFALPGNHDWYDGLKAFSSTFCTTRRNDLDHPSGRIGHWQTRQTRSYFALKLPQNWWLCAVDIQLAADLNAAQIDYFSDIVRSAMQPGDNIILCSPVPSWVFAKVRDPGAQESFIEIATMLSTHGAAIRLVLTGDLHHYSRYQPAAAGPQLITAGGGGAFKHPTHKLPEQVDLPQATGERQIFDLAAVYPSKATSRALSYKTLLFPLINWDFAAVIGGVYAVLAWFLETRRLSGEAPLSRAFLEFMAGDHTLTGALARFFETIPKSPEFAIVVFAVYVGLINVNQTHRRLTSLVLGTAHTALHFAALIAAFCIAVQAASWINPQFDQLGGAFVLFLGLMMLIGGLLGGFVFGLFLLFSLNVLGLQWTNTFSSLRIADFGNFVRLHIDGSGVLTVYPFKVDVAQRATPAGMVKPGSQAELIEPPISLR